MGLTNIGAVVESRKRVLDMRAAVTLVEERVLTHTIGTVFRLLHQSNRHCCGLGSAIPRGYIPEIATTDEDLYALLRFLLIVLTVVQKPGSLPAVLSRFAYYQPETLALLFPAAATAVSRAAETCIWSQPAVVIARISALHQRDVCTSGKTVQRDDAWYLFSICSVCVMKPAHELCMQ